jgi:3-oxoacyl-[acyl-carrier protein] reductase
MSEKTILVTGATGDLGSVVLPRLLRDYRCAVLYRSQSGWERLQSSVGNNERLVGYPGEMSDEASLRRGAERAAPLYGIVHLAGGFSEMSTTADFEQMIDLNLMSAVRTFRAAQGEITSGGRIVAVSSIMTATKPAFGAAYVVSKSALNTYVEILAKELRPRNITVNALLCGPMDTEKNAAAMPGQQLVPRTRIAESIAFLLSDDAGSTTGQLIAVA